MLSSISVSFGYGANNAGAPLIIGEEELPMLALDATRGSFESSVISFFSPDFPPFMSLGVTAKANPAGGGRHMDFGWFHTGMDVWIRDVYSPLPRDDPVATVAMR